MEMVLGIELFKSSTPAGASIVPLAFPLIAGAGSITTMLSLRAAYGYLEIISALVLNMIFVYFTLRSTRLIERFLGPTGVAVLRKVFGILLLSIAIKLFMSNFVSSLETFFPGLIEKMKNY
jgi:multiple antibiotic resistance protein